MRIHATAIVDPKAELAEDVRVEAYSIVGPYIQMGSGTIVGPHCVIEGRTVIGKNNRFFSGAQIGVLCQDLKHKAGLVGQTAIGDGNTFREHVTISASTMETADDDHRVTSIGDGCLFMACAHVGHDCHIGDHVIIANNTLLAGHVEVEDYAQLSGLCAVHQECAIGAMAFVGGCSRINKDVPPYMLVEGNPARCAGPNTVGLRRNGLDAAARARIKTMYKVMYRADLNTAQALHEIETSVEDAEDRTRFLEFVRKSIRGIVK